MKFKKPLFLKPLKIIFVMIFSLLPFSQVAPATLAPNIRKHTVKIICTFAGHDYCAPWKLKPHHTKVGSGAIISGKVILTNAHVVSDATYIQVQKENDPVLYNASVRHVSHEADLALLTVDEPGFFKGTGGLGFGGLPFLRSRVATYGYPIGGERISITEGVISRIEIGKYAHDGESAFLMIQTDAAINPGNSGGPAIQDGKIVGLAFQHVTKTSNIGYLIPVSVIRHFLSDVADGRYDGYPSLGIMTDKLLNRGFRGYLGMKKGGSGIVVTRVLPGGSSYDFLKKDDVIMAVDGVDIASDGSVPLGDGRIDYDHLIYSKQAGETVKLKIMRSRSETVLSFPLKVRRQRIPWNNEYGRRPRYIILSGLVFQPLSNEYAKCWGKWSETADPRVMYSYYFHDRDMVDPWREEFVILSRILPDPSNTYLTEIHDRLVNDINGVRISRMEDVLSALKNPLGDFHVINLEGVNKPVVLRVSEAPDAEKRILKNYQIISPMMLER